MRKTFLTALTALALVVLLAGGAAATMIVNTGIPVSPSGDVQYPWPDGVFVLAADIWHAGRFTTTETYNITSVKGWMGYGNAQGMVNAVIRSDRPFREGVTVPGDILYSGSFYAPGGYSQSGFFWQGVSGVNWSLPAGTYWAAFEVPYNGDFTYQGLMSRYAPDPMSSYAYAEVFAWDFIFRGYGNYIDLARGDTFPGFGMQVEGISPTPLPGTLLLLGSALAGLGGWRRFRKN